METVSQIRQGSRVFLKNAVAGEPGMVAGFDRRGRALVDWSMDMPELNRLIAHDPESLVVDEGFTVRQFELAFDEQAA